MPTIGNLRSISFNMSILEITELKFRAAYVLFFCLIKWMENLCTFLCTFCVLPLFMWNLQTDSRSFKFKRQTHMSHNVCLWKEILLIFCHISATKKRKTIESEICNRCTVLKAVCGLITSTVCQLVTGRRTFLNLKLVESVRNIKS